MSFSDYTHLDFLFVSAETEKAMLFKLKCGVLVWIPKSVIADVDDYAMGDINGTISVQDWWAKKEGIVIL